MSAWFDDYEKPVSHRFGRLSTGRFLAFTARGCYSLKVAAEGIAAQMDRRAKVCNMEWLMLLFESCR
jgi:hypothetical protein